MLCQHCGTDTPHPAIACQSCRTPFPQASVANTDSETITFGTGAATGAMTGATAAPPKKATGPLELGAPFGTRYRILRELGAGGMGVVYQAWDAELGVAVALKVVRPEVSNDPEISQEVTRRFKRELLLARQVTHKNVVRIHDLGEIDGIKYITMPYIEGRDLAGLLRERGQLPPPEALRIGKQVAAGLLAAHDAGVVHRDLKPENIMIDADGQALIMDFGISRSVTTGTATVTAAGAVMGTLEYMAPEQASGATVDHRADIYAFGLIMHDMLAGRRRIAAGSNALSEMMGRMQQQPPPLRTLAPEIPEPLERIVTKCLQPKPEQRYETTRALVDELNSLDPDGHGARRPISRDYQWKIATATMLVLILIGMGTAVWYTRRHMAPPTPAAALQPLLVLIADFENQTGDPVFEGSLEQSLAIALEGSPFINIFPRRDALRIAERLKPGRPLNEERARLVSRREGIGIILTGQIKRAGSGYELAVRAIDAASDQERATASEKATDKQGVLTAAAKLAERVRGALGDTAARSGRSGDSETFTASSLDAVKSYSMAQDLMARGRYEESIAHYKRATEQDPKLGRAYSGWATSAYFLGRSEEAGQLLQKAVQLLDQMTEREKLRTQGAYFFIATQNYPKAIENYTEMVQRFPADLAAQNNLAVAQFNVLNFKKALEHGGKALEIYPKNVIIRSNYALYAMYAGDFATAAAEAPKVIEIDKTFHKAYLVQAMAALADGKPDAARTAYNRMATESDATGALVATLGLADIAMYYGQWDEAEKLLKDSLAADRTANNPATLGAKLIALSEVYARRNRPGDAAEAVKVALQALPLEGNSIPAGIALARLGRAAEASPVAQKLAASVQDQNRAYAGIINGMLALRRNASTEAIDALRNAKGRADFWLGRYALGIAYVQSDLFVEGLAELEACEKRRGEATAAFLDDLPTFRYLSELPYWKGRAQQGLGSSAAADSFRAFLALRQGTGADPLVADARARLPK